MPKPRRKKINFELIPEARGKATPEPYLVLRKVRDAWHDHLADARIALAWRKEAKPDKDGRLVLGKVKKASDLDRELAPYDLVVILNEEAWGDLSPAQREALMDHELSHVAVVLDDATGRPKLDERGRTCYRLRKHDLEEFRAVVERHGCYLDDVAEFVRAVRRSRDAGLSAGLEADPVAGRVS